jgi:hypothetical protein
MGGSVGGGGVDVPAEAVGVGVEVEGACVGATCGVEAHDIGFGELTCEEICDLDVAGELRSEGMCPRG